MNSVAPRPDRFGLARKMGLMGFGAAPLGNMNRVVSEDEAAAVLAVAWNSGVRYFDTAPLYGHGLSEMRVGMFLASRSRQEFVLSTKVGRVLEPCSPGDEASGIYKQTPPFRVRWDFTRDGIMRGFEASVRRLGGTRPDIVLCHDLDPITLGEEAYAAHWRDLVDRGGWLALEELRGAGDTTAIGAGLNEVEPALRFATELGADAILIAGRYTLLDRSANVTLLPTCAKSGTLVVAGGPFNSGILATGAVEGARYAYAEAPAAVLQHTRRLEAVCSRHGVPLPVAALQFVRRHPAITCVIPGGQAAQEVEGNARAMDVDVPEQVWVELERVGSLDSSQELSGC